MTIAEVIILIFGVILFVASFFVTGKNGSGRIDPISEGMLRKFLKQELEKEMSGYKSQIEDSAEECIQDNKDKMERFMDRVTNEKMLAVSEYSDGVLERIHKNHEEAVFLYDMLNNKHAQIKNTAVEISNIEKSVKNLSEQNERNIKAYDNTVKKEAQRQEEVKQELKMPNLVPKEEVPDFQPMAGSTVFTDKKESKLSENQAKSKAQNNDNKKKKEIKEFKPIQVPRVVVPVEEPVEIGTVNVGQEQEEGQGFELMFDADGQDANSSKEQIIALHKSGKSNMAIAKALGLGIGEVKLVLDLYKA